MTKKLVSVLLIATLLSGCAHQPKLGSYADAATTYVALNSGQFVEANPLLQWGNPTQTALASLGLKQGSKYALSPLVGRKEADLYVESGGFAAASWNTALMLGATNPVGAVSFVLAGYLYYKYNK